MSIRRYFGGLLVSEVGMSMDEMRQFMEIAVGEANGRHGSGGVGEEDQT